MNKPTIKKEVEVSFYYADTRTIEFHSTQDAVTEFASFGKLIKFSDYPDRYNLTVDTRFDFDEVLNYIKNYG